MTAIAMNVLLQQLQERVPTYNVALVPKDATGAYASPVHIIAGLLKVTSVYIQRIIYDICTNVIANCTKMKVIVNGTEQRNRIMVGDAESILRILGSCNRPDMAAIVARLPVVVPVVVHIPRELTMNEEVYWGTDPSKHFSKGYLDVWGPCIYKLYDIPRSQHQSATIFEQKRQRTRLELYEPSISPIFKLPREILSIIIQCVPTECASVCALFWDVVCELRKFEVLRQPTLIDQTRMAIRRQNYEDFKSVLKKNLENYAKFTNKYGFLDPGVIKFITKHWDYNMNFKIPDPDLILLAHTPKMVGFLSRHIGYENFGKFVTRFSKIIFK